MPALTRVVREALNPTSKRELTVYDCVLLFEVACLKTVVGIPRRDAELGGKAVVAAMTPAQLQRSKCCPIASPVAGRIPRLLKEHRSESSDPKNSARSSSRAVACHERIAW